MSMLTIKFRSSFSNSSKPSCDLNVSEKCFDIFAVVRKMAKEGKPKLYREDLTYTPRELGDIELGLSRFLVVRYTLRVPIDGHSTKAPEHRKQHGKGSEVLGSVIPWDP